MGNLLSKTDITIPSTTQPTTTQPPNYANSELMNDIISKQSTLITKLNDITGKINLNLNNTPSPTSPTSPTTSNVSPFTNITNQYQGLQNNRENFQNFQKYDDQLEKLYLPQSMIPDLNDISNAYNASVTDMKENNYKIIEDAKFNQYLHIQDNKLRELQNSLNSFPSSDQIQNPIKSIKNIQTSQILNLEEYQDPTLPTTPETADKYYGYKGNGATRYPNYLIYGNNGCLDYNVSKQEYNFMPCNATNGNQRFNLNQITTLEQYNSKITTPQNKDYRIASTDNTIMGFYVVNPENDTNSCLTLNSDGLSVLPCNMDSSQRFKAQYHTVLP